MNNKLDGLDLEVLQHKQVKVSDTETMTLGETARWTLLGEALEVAEKEATERETTLDYDMIVSKERIHKAICKYIDERYFACIRDIIIENNIPVTQ